MKAIFISLIILSFNCYAKLKLEDMSGTDYITGSGETRTYPKLVDVRAIATDHNGGGCIIDGSTKIKCWGNNALGTLPAKVSNLVNPRKIAIGNNITCVMDDEGIRCLLPKETDEYLFREALNEGGYTQMAIAGYYNNLCAIDGDSVVKCVELGYNKYDYSIRKSYEIYGFVNPVQIIGMEYFVLVLDDEGVKYYYTYKKHHEAVAEKIYQLKKPIQIVTNGYEFCALCKDGNKHEIKCWYGQGNNSVSPKDLLNKKPNLTVKVSENITQISMSMTGVHAINGNNVESWKLKEQSFWKNNKPRIFSNFKNLRQIEGQHDQNFCFIDDDGIKCMDFDENEDVECKGAKCKNCDVSLYLSNNGYRTVRYFQNTFYPHLNSFHKRKALLIKKYVDNKLKFEINYKYFFTQLNKIFIDNFEVDKINDLKATLVDRLKSFKDGFDVEREKQKNLLNEMGVDVNLDYRKAPIEVIMNKNIKQVSLELFRSAVKNSLGSLQEHDRQLLYSLIEQNDNDLEKSISNNNVEEALQTVYLNPYTKPLGAVALALRGLF